jgi:hypothetical protein
MGSNTNRYAQLSVAREALRATFPDIHFGEMMETLAAAFTPLSAINWPNSAQRFHPILFMICLKNWNDAADGFLKTRLKE